MKGSRLRFGLFLLAVLPYCLFHTMGSAAQQVRHTLLIDPAHGGQDTGVVSDTLREKDLTMKLALLFRQEAQKSENLKVQLTRSTDTGMTVAERIKIVDAVKPDCLISLHVNAGFGKKATGYELYFPGFRQTVAGRGDSAAILKDMARNKHLNDAVRLAQQIQSSLEKVFPRKGRGLRDAPCPLLDGLNIPGLVVEIGFATNPEDRSLLNSNETQQAIAKALVRGVQGYFHQRP